MRVPDTSWFADPGGVLVYCVEELTKRVNKEHGKGFETKDCEVVAFNRV